MNVDKIKLKSLQDKYNEVKADNEAIFERQMKGEAVSRSEWLDAKQRLESAKAELDSQVLKVKELEGEVMSDSEIDEILGDVSGDYDDSDPILEAIANGFNW